MCKKLIFGNSMSGKSQPLPNLPKDLRIADPHEEIAQILLGKRAEEPKEKPKLGKRIKSLLMSCLMQNAEEPPTQ